MAPYEIPQSSTIRLVFPSPEDVDHPTAALECEHWDSTLVLMWSDLRREEEGSTFREMSRCVGRSKRQPCPDKCPTEETHHPDREERRSKRWEPAGAIRISMEKVQLEEVTSQKEFCGWETGRDPHSTLYAKNLDNHLEERFRVCILS